MIIYLDTMIVQYIADNYEYIFLNSVSFLKTSNDLYGPKFAEELGALRRLVYLEQFGDWDFAVSSHLMNELLDGNPTNEQRATYHTLLQAWMESGWIENSLNNEEAVSKIDHLLLLLKLKDKADRRHLAEALALGASWFITNDTNIIKRSRQKQHELSDLTDKVTSNDPNLTNNQMLKRLLQRITIAKPSECVSEIEQALTLR